MTAGEVPDVSDGGLILRKHVLITSSVGNTVPETWHYLVSSPWQDHHVLCEKTEAQEG